MTHPLTNLELERFNVPDGLCVRLQLKSERVIILPCDDIYQEDRVADSIGCHPLDRLEIRIAGEPCWVERRDLCHEDGAVIEWCPYPKSDTEPQTDYIPEFGEIAEANHAAAEERLKYYEDHPSAYKEFF